MAATKYDNVLVQRALNETMGTALKADGAIGPASLKVVAQYQKAHGLPTTGQLDDVTRAHLQPFIESRFVTVDQVVEMARQFKLHPAALLAFWQVESRGAGFLDDGRCVILFERHKFYQYAAERVGRAQAEQWRKAHPDLCHPEQDSAFYSNGPGEWDRLGRAAQLDGTCALLSASWGLFQVMGFNYVACGFQDVQSMVGAFQENERNQLQGAVRFILSQRNLVAAMQAQNWATVARIYNGPAYAKNQYDTKLKAAFDTWSRIYK